MKKTTFFTALCATVLVTTMAAEASIVQQVEEGAEVARLDLRLNGAGEGQIYARVCDQCEMLTLTVNAKTLAFVRKRPVSLAEAERRRGEGATVLFDPKSRIVTRIVFWFDK